MKMEIKTPDSSDLSDEEYQAAEHEMREQMEKWNRMHSRVLSASWASADNRRDPGHTPHELARLADKRMYRVIPVLHIFILKNDFEG